MTDDGVYITANGRKYHTTTEQDCLATSKGTCRVPLALAAETGLEPCGVCMPPRPAGVSEIDVLWMRRIADWERAHVFESVWEQAFVRRVLAHIPDVDIQDVEPQRVLRDTNPPATVDFYLPRFRLVLEVDGFSKSGAPLLTEPLTRNQRDADLRNRGYEVLHFANAEVADAPDRCRQRVTDTLHRIASATATSPTVPVPVGPPATTQTVHVVASPPTVNSVPTPESLLSRTMVGTSPPAEELGSNSSGRAQRRRAAEVGTTVTRRNWAWVVAIAAVATLSIGAWILLGPRTSTSGGSSPTASGSCPADFPIKGNIAASGERIAHSPGQDFYTRTLAERCFRDLAAAASEGYRPAQR